MRVEADGTVDVTVTVNGRAVTLAVAPRTTLSDVLRDRLGLTGTHVGCEHGVCGMCTVLLDGEAVRACLLFAVQCDGASLTTVEGLGSRRRPAPPAAGVLPPPRAAVRLLHARDAHELLRPARGRHLLPRHAGRGHVRRALPLHRLPRHPRRSRRRRGDPPRRRPATPRRRAAGARRAHRERQRRGAADTQCPQRHADDRGDQRSPRARPRPRSRSATTSRPGWTTCGPCSPTSTASRPACPARR